MSLVEQYREWLAESPVPGAEPDYNNPINHGWRHIENMFSNHKELRSGASRLGPGDKKNQLVRNLGNIIRRTAIVSDAVKRAKNLGFKKTK